MSIQDTRNNNKFGPEINDKLHTEIQSGTLYHATNDKNAVVLFCAAKLHKVDKPRFVTDCCLRNLAIYMKQTSLPKIDKLIELVAVYQVCSLMDLTDRYFNIRVVESSEQCNTILTTHV